MSAARIRWLYVVDLIVVAACVLALLAAWQIHQRDDRLATNRAEVEQQAGPLVAQVFSAKVEESDQDRKRARSLVTDEFAQQYAQILDPDADSAPTSSLTWTPVHTGVSAVTADHADAVVSATVTQVGANAEPSTHTRVLDVRLERSGDEWKLARADEVL